MMLKSKRVIATAVALMLANFARADVLESVPADTLVAIKFANLQKTSDKVAKLAKDFGIDAFLPPVQNPLASSKEALGVSKGINDAGEGAVAFFTPKQATDVPRRQPAMVILVPVSNYAEFLSNFADAKTEGAVSVVKIAGDNDNSYIADWNGYAAVSNSKLLVSTKPSATLKPAGLSAKEAAKQDVLVYANMGKIAAEVTPEMERGITRALADFDRDAKREIPAKWVPVLRVAITQLFGIGRGFMRDAEVATLGINISDNGINATVAAQFKPDSYAAKLGADLKNTDKILTTGLPSVKYLYYGGSDLQSPAIARGFDDLTKPILDELNKVEGQEKTQKLAADISKSMRTLKSFASGIVAPGKIGQDALLQQIAIYDGDSKQFIELANTGAEVATSLFADIKMPNGQQTPKLTTTDPDKTVEGVTLKNWKLDFAPNKEDPQAQQMQPMMDLFYGPEGLTYQFGSLDDTHYVFTSCASEETLASFIKSAKGKEDNISKLEHVKVVTDELPKQRVAEAYIALDEIVSTGVAAAGTFGLTVPVQLPPDLPPVGMTIGGDTDAVRMDVHIPSATVQSLIAAGMQVYMQMSQQRGGQL